MGPGVLRPGPYTYTFRLARREVEIAALDRFQELGELGIAHTDRLGTGVFRVVHGDGFPGKFNADAIACGTATCGNANLLGHSDAHFI